MNEQYLIDYDKVRASRKKNNIIYALIAISLLSVITLVLNKVSADRINERRISSKDIETSNMVTHFTAQLDSLDVVIKALMLERTDLINERKTMITDLSKKDIELKNSYKTISTLQRRLNENVTIPTNPNNSTATTYVERQALPVQQSKYFETAKQEQVNSSNIVLNSSKNEIINVFYTSNNSDLKFVKAYSKSNKNINLSRIDESKLQFKPISSKSKIIYYSNSNDFRAATLIQSELYSRDRIKAVVHKVSTTGKSEPIVIH